MTGGITTTQDLRDRCWVDEDTGCWHWRGGRSMGRPNMWFVPLGRTASLSQVIGHLKTGKPLRKGLLCYATCTTPNCANPEHRKVGTRQGQASVLVAQGRLAKSPQVRALMSRRRRTRVLTDEAVAQIRASTKSCKDEAAERGVSISLVSLIRRNKARATVVPGASVFTFGGVL